MAETPINPEGNSAEVTALGGYPLSDDEVAILKAVESIREARKEKIVSITAPELSFGEKSFNEKVVRVMTEISKIQAARNSIQQMNYVLDNLDGDELDFELGDAAYELAVEAEIMVSRRSKQEEIKQAIESAKQALDAMYWV